jgi:thymidylate synthase ThyX
MTLSHILDDKTVTALQRAGRRLKNIYRAESRKQWELGRLANDVWDNLPADMKEEIRKVDFYAECSQWINHAAGRAVVGTSGETLRRWADVEKYFRQFPDLDAWKDALKFHHFEWARKIGGNILTNTTAPEALALAVHHNWTAEEMSNELDKKQSLLPEVIEIRSRYPLFGRFADFVLTLNGSRKQVEYHMSEIARLVETEKKK